MKIRKTITDQAASSQIELVKNSGIM